MTASRDDLRPLPALAHDVAGDAGAPAVLLLHAGVADHRMWDAVAPALAHAFRVIRPDLRGYGDSPLLVDGTEYTNAGDLADLLDELGVADAVVVGASFGGKVALELATAHPGRVRELVLLCPAAPGVPDTAASDAFDEEEARLLGAGDVEGAVRLNVTTWLGPDADDAARQALTVMQRRAFEVQLAADAAASAAGLPEPGPRPVEIDLGAVHVPTVVVEGAHDMDQLRACARHVAASVPGAELSVLDWAGHLPVLERPDAMRALLLDVLRDDPTVHAP
ncbi:alpha/beta fold hydrolase [Krasilnikoviella flava]|uniref:Pimeloyl-ACP methyl ester carboxylesterase n=1 Tax=Krasilnikoviella flava TaxID=526729 RepID=A0A1T5L559_9MICO|nr:alpha/beta fold hydrolase [Krasilnikoviella flava]SKC71177.1 Pimeloyl-ACP methyl ester carboxylesterase [Krasilnikoviella flava]